MVVGAEKVSCDALYFVATVLLARAGMPNDYFATLEYVPMFVVGALLAARRDRAAGGGRGNSPAAAQASPPKSLSMPAMILRREMMAFLSFIGGFITS